MFCNAASNFVTTNNTCMKKNEKLQRCVQEAINNEPLLSISEIGVTARNGIITLTGTVDSLAKKWEAERATKNVNGVKAVVEKIEIEFFNALKKSNTEIAQNIIDAFSKNIEIPIDKIKIRVEKGWVTLEGELKYHSQKNAVMLSLNNITDILGVNDDITINADATDAIEKKLIELSIARNWLLEKLNLQVQVLDNDVTLNGNVNSLIQKEKANEIAWNTKGVRSVKNELYVLA